MVCHIEIVDKLNARYKCEYETIEKRKASSTKCASRLSTDADDRT